MPFVYAAPSIPRRLVTGVRRQQDHGRGDGGKLDGVPPEWQGTARGRGHGGHVPPVQEG